MHLLHHRFTTTHARVAITVFDKGSIAEGFCYCFGSIVQSTIHRISASIATCKVAVYDRRNNVSSDTLRCIAPKDFSTTSTGIVGQAVASCGEVSGEYVVAADRCG